MNLWWYMHGIMSGDVTHDGNLCIVCEENECLCSLYDSSTDVMLCVFSDVVMIFESNICIAYKYILITKGWEKRKAIDTTIFSK